MTRRRTNGPHDRLKIQGLQREVELLGALVAFYKDQRAGVTPGKW